MKPQRTTPTFAVEVLEARTLLSASLLELGHPHEDKHGSGGGQDTHVEHQNGETTPITDLTGQATNITQVLALASPGLPHVLCDSPGGLEVATLTSATSHVKLHGYSVMIDWGDGTAATKGKLKVDKSGVVHVMGSHAYAAEGTFTVTVTVTQHLTDSAATPGTPDPTITILSSASVTQDSATGVTINPTTGSEFTGPIGSFSTTTATDPNAFTTIVSWGDGSRSLGTVTLNGDGTFSVGGTHTYATAGTYRVTILVYQHGNPSLGHGNGHGDGNQGDQGDHQDTHQDTGWHLGWRKHGFFTMISSTAIVADAPPAPVTTP